MDFSLALDIHSITDLKRNTKKILARAHETGNPVVLTLNGRADAVLLDAAAYERDLSAAAFARLLAPAEEDVRAGRTRPLRSALKRPEYRRAS